MSFTAALQNLKTQLKADAALQAFAAAKWNRSVTVAIGHRERKEIGMKELPLIRITRPSVGRTELSNVRDGRHQVRLYCGFYQPDRDKGALEVVEFEELIDAAILADETLGGAAIQADPGESVNDEGVYHPSYFMVKELEIHHRQY